ncbi:lysylphosphatidylglycerol synthase transmembrane domain-containing protein [Streptomyces sp. NPDC003233]
MRGAVDRLLRRGVPIAAGRRRDPLEPAAHDCSRDGRQRRVGCAARRSGVLRRLGLPAAAPPGRRAGAHGRRAGRGRWTVGTRSGCPARGRCGRRGTGGAAHRSAPCGRGALVLGIALAVVEATRLPGFRKAVGRAWTDAGLRSRRIPQGQEALVHLVEQARSLQPGLRPWLPPFAFAPLNWVFGVACLAIGLRALGIGVPWHSLLLAYVLTQAPPQQPSPDPGSLGIVETSLSALLVLSRLRPGPAIAATLLYRAVSYWACSPSAGRAGSPSRSGPVRRAPAPPLGTTQKSPSVTVEERRLHCLRGRSATTASVPTATAPTTTTSTTSPGGQRHRTSPGDQVEGRHRPPTLSTAGASPLGLVLHARIRMGPTRPAAVPFGQRRAAGGSGTMGWVAAAPGRRGRSRLRGWGGRRGSAVMDWRPGRRRRARAL